MAAIQLTRRGWNNVLILAVLAFIGIFQFSHNQLFQSKAIASAPLADEQIIMEVQLPNRTFQRVGSGWRSSDPAWSEERITAWLPLFKQSYPTIDVEPLPVAEQVIQLHLLAESEPLVLFWLPSQGLLYQANQVQAWQIPAEVAAVFTQASQP